jgi:CRISPR-associated protein Csm4
MDNMRLFRVDYQLLSPTASAWHADTIFGHLCWAMRYSEGEDALSEFLGNCCQGRPPILVSNGFPAGLFPNPIIPPCQTDSTLPLKEQRERAERKKKARKINLLTLDDFNRAINGEEFEPVEPEKGKPIERVVLKNQINRLTGTTGAEGTLFDFEETFYPAISIYAGIEENFVQRAKRLFDLIRDGGYGKRKSVGYGQIKSYSFEQFDDFSPPADANGFVTLSNYVPSAGDPTTGNWRLLVKYGKLGEEYALEEMAFKKPLLMLEAGSTFYNPPVKPFYGRMVHDISRVKPQVVQYGFALPVPMRLPQL